MQQNFDTPPAFLWIDVIYLLRTYGTLEKQFNLAKFRLEDPNTN